MKRTSLFIFAALLAFCFAPAARAQCTLTQVSGTVKDPSGIPYAGGTVQVSLVPAPPGSPLCNGVAISSPLGPPTTLDSTGSFSLAIPANSAITPGGTQWLFTVNQSPGVAPPFGVGPVSFSLAITITNTGTQSVTTQLTAAALALTVPFSSSGGGNPAGATGDLQDKASSTTFGAAHINDNGTTLTFSENVLPTASQNIGLKYFSGDSWRFVDSAGSDSNDGLSPGTPLADLMTAYDALPASGGTISACSSNGGLIPATATAGQGIWIMGPSDPNFGAPPAGWRKAKPVYFLGSCGNVRPTQGSKPIVNISTGVTATPSIWLSSIAATALTFENLGFVNFNQPINVQIGVDSTGAQTSSSGVVGAGFQNVLTQGCNSLTTCGPGWLIGGGDTFNIYMDHMVINGNPGATVGSDNQAAVLVKPASASNAAVGLSVLSNSLLAGGGFKFYHGTNGSGFTIKHVLSEAIAGPGSAPGIATVWLANAGFSDVFVEDITTSDQSGIVYDLRTDGGLLDDEAAVTAVGDFFSGIFGQASVAGTINVPITDPLVQNQTGWINGRGYGFISETQRAFSPTAVRFLNIAPTLSSGWTATQIGGTTTFTQGITAPDGCTGAGTPVSTCVTGAAQASNATTTHQESIRFVNSNIAIASGDWFIGGFWERSASATPLTDVNSLIIGGSGNTTNCGRLNPPFTTDGDWTWVWQVCQITAVTTTPAPVSFQGVYSSTDTLQVYAPTLLHLTSSQASQNEAYEIANNLVPYNNTCAVGSICGISSAVISNSFASLTTGVNTTAIMTVGAGSSLLLANATAFTVPAANGFTSSATLNFGIDNGAGANNPHCWNGATDLICLGIAVPGVINNGDVLQFLVTSTNIQVQDLAGVGGGGTKFLEYTPQGSGATMAAGNYIGGNGSNIAAELTPGFTGVNISASGTTVLLSSYRGEIVKASSTSGSQTFALSDGTVTGFTGNYYIRICNHGTVGNLTITNNGGSFTFSGAASPYLLPEGYCADLNPNSSNNGWTVVAFPGTLVAGSGITITQTQFGGTFISNTPYVAAAGSVNVLTAAYSPAVASLTTGLELDFLPNLANTTTTPTFNPNGLGAGTITKFGTAALAANDLTTTAVAKVIYDGTRWQLQNPQTASAGAGSALSAITAAAGANTIANGNNGAQVWNWAQTTNSQTAFTFGETTAATGTSDLELAVTTLAGSTAVPLTVTDSLTGSQAIAALSVGCTWNTTGVVDACLLVNVGTNTASGAASKIADFQVAGASQFNIDKAGNLNSPAGTMTWTGGGTININAGGTGGNVIMKGSATSGGLVEATSGSTSAVVFLANGIGGQTGDLLRLDVSAGIKDAWSAAGIQTTYNSIATVGVGYMIQRAVVDLTAQTAAVTATTIYTPTATGRFRISGYLKVTTAATTSSILGGTTGIVITYTDGTDSVAQSVTIPVANQAGNTITIGTGNTGNATTTVSQGDVYIYAKTGVAIQYAIGYTSVGGTPMAYEAHLLAEAAAE